MVFTNNIKIRDCDIPLITDFLEELIDRDLGSCRRKAKQKGFIFLDAWDNKAGFVKEGKNTHYILSLYFKKKVCDFYQVIVKNDETHWLNSQVFDYQSVRDQGIV